ncbi:MAG: tRNA (adenosine(37)-N6)-threonylcarbamoyltransferase complex dimerization subunit type 1 TsaB [Armatimonadota bacterium]
MYILAIESTTNLCSVALGKDGKIIGELHEDIPQRQLTWLMPAVDKLLKENGVEYPDINYIAVTNGPGSYTGLRLGIITAKTIAQVLDIPVIAYNTLEALAYNAETQDTVIYPMLDAKKKQIYSAKMVKEGKYLKSESDYRAYTPSELIEEINKSSKEVVLLGTALHTYKEDIKEKLQVKYSIADSKCWHPKAETLITMAYRDIEQKKANLLSHNDLDAFYLREPDITPPRKAV